jgi:hypothetical protein
MADIKKDNDKNKAEEKATRFRESDGKKFFRDQNVTFKDLYDIIYAEKNESSGSEGCSEERVFDETTEEWDTQPITEIAKRIKVVSELELNGKAVLSFVMAWVVKRLAQPATSSGNLTVPPVATPDGDDGAQDSEEPFSKRAKIAALTRDKRAQEAKHEMEAKAEKASEFRSALSTALASRSQADALKLAPGYQDPSSMALKETGQAMANGLKEGCSALAAGLVAIAKAKIGALEPNSDYTVHPLSFSRL